jgi:hypothetical protein
VRDWRAALKTALREAMRARNADAMAVLRTTLGAIDNAESVSMSAAPPVEAGVIAGGVAGLGAGEVARRTLSDAETEAVIRRELAERVQGALEYERLGQPADVLRAQAAVLEAILG